MTYWAGEDIPIGTELEPREDETMDQLAERASERFDKAMAIIEEALMAHPELGVAVGSRYDDDMSIWDDAGKRVWGSW